MGSESYKLHSSKERKNKLSSKSKIEFQKRTAQAFKHTGRGDQGVGTLATLFVLGIASSLIVTTVNLHLKIERKQKTLMRDFQNEWNK